MHAPRPYGLFVDGGELTERDKTFISHQMRKLTNTIQTEEVTSYRHQYELPDGGYVIVQDMGGIFKAIAHKGYTSPDAFKPDGFAKLYVPMLYSGVITKAQVRKPDEGKFGEGVGIKLTEQARRRLAGYNSNNLPAKEVFLQRFVVEYNPYFKYFEPRFTGIYTFTQYAKQRPTWYSGAMVEVMQIVGGYGKLQASELPDKSIERAQLIIPDKYIEAISDKLKGYRLPGYTGIPPLEGQFQFDYKFSKTHAVSFDNHNKPWLIQVGGIGVYAMPLPIIPTTTTPEFRRYVEDMGDDELLKILDRFGAMPSGEGFPEKPGDFQAWRRAGVIIKVCDMADFYQHGAFYDACGWSFNGRGAEGFNTCWSYNDVGLIYSYAYKMKLSLTATEDNAPNGWLKTTWAFESEQDSTTVNRYLQALFNILDTEKGRELAIRYKIGRQTTEQILIRARDNPVMDRKEVLYWDNLELEPIATHTGNVTRVASGPVYWGNPNPMSFGYLKFPEISGQGCESFKPFSPDYKGGFVRCDTIVFGCYINNQLQVVKYFLDERKFTKEVESTFEDVMIVGQWKKTETTGTTGLMGYLYTSDFDDRQEASPSTSYTTIKGSDLGYGQPAFQTPYLLFTHGSLGRARYYKHETTTKTISSFSIGAAVCIPVFSRDAILYAFEQSSESESTHEKHTRGGIADPTSYPLWTYDPIFHYMGGSGKGKPSPKTGDKVYVYGPPNYYSPTITSDFADSGDWYGVGSSYIDVSGICAPYTDRNGAQHHAGGVVIGGEAPQIEPFEKTEAVHGKLSGRVSISYAFNGSSIAHRNKPDEWYFAFSPVDAGGTPHYFYQDACRVGFGDSEYASIYEKGAYGLRIRWGYTQLADHKSAHHFIGVINE